VVAQPPLPPDPAGTSKARRRKVLAGGEGGRRVEAVNPSTPSSAWREMSPKWSRVETLLGGTDSMRAAGKKYLPQHENEKDENYRERLDRAVLYNMTQDVLESLVGRPFSEPMKVSDDCPPVMRNILDDVDLQGNAVGVFCRKWFKEGLAKGLAHVLVDYPTLPALPEGETRTAATDQKDERRPYWVFIKPENLIAANSVVRDGREILTHARILEEEKIPHDTWGERTVKKVRVFDCDPDQDVVTFRVFTLREDEKEWEETTPATQIDRPRIPLVTFYADRTGLMTAKPPMEDLANLNVAHWQSDSDQRNVMTVARFPMLAVSGVDDSGGKVVIGPKRVLSTPEATGRWYYVEHGGAAIAAGRQDLLDLEEKMSGHGAEFLRKKPGSQTATARALDSAEATSPLEDVVQRFNDAVAQVMDVTGGWLGLDEVGSVAVATDLGPETIEAADFDALKSARDRRDISRKTLLGEYQRRGVLSADFDADKDEEELRGEDVGGAATTGPIDLLAAQ